MPTRCPLALAALTLAALAAPDAPAQDALGDGRALQRNNQVVPSTGLPPRGRDIMQEIRFRNAIVTGNAPGGLSFRGDLGYTDPFEFRGDLASDDLFEFRRDSLYSGLAGVGLRGTNALQYQMALTTGSAPPAGLTGGFSVSRDGSRAFGSNANAPGVGGFAAPGFGLRTDDAADQAAAFQNSSFQPDGGWLRELRSTAAYAANNTLRESLLTTFDTPEGRIGVVASPLRGVRPTALGVTDALRARALGQQTPADEEDTEPLGITNRATSAYDELMNRLQADEQTDGDDESAIEAQLAELRRSLRGLDTGSNAGTGTDADEEADDGFNPDTLDLLRRRGGEMETLVDPDAEQRDIFGDHMAAAARLLNAGRFFDAEARFVTALSVRPGDPTALIGRVHAQLGAGLFDSAAVNLRALIARHPELAGVRYGAGARPSDERMAVVMRLLRPRATGPDGSVRIGHATLLAYVAFQLGDEDTLAEALALLDRAAENDPDRAGRPVDAFIRTIWTDAPANGNTDQPNTDDAPE
jgi:tetratricopeptide (TPR) repeat protein